MLFGEIPSGSIVVVDVAENEGEKEFTFVATPKVTLPDTPPVETAGQE